MMISPRIKKLAENVIGFELFNEIFLCVVFSISLMRFKGGSPQKMSRQWLAQKIHPVGQFFGWVWRPQTIRGARGGHAHFPAKSDPKIKNNIITQISHHQSIDNGLLNSHHKFKPLNYMFCAICNSIYAKMSNLCPKNL